MTNRLSFVRIWKNVVYSAVLHKMVVLRAIALAQELQRAAAVIHAAKSIIITSGAGLSVDSGLPDFRGKDGFWQSYPPLKKLGINLTETNQPRWFEKDPHMAWGFFGHCYNMYQAAQPHEGFKILKKWCEMKDDSYFIYTSNVDGHFQRAGFADNRIVECHGSINYLQCTDPKQSKEIWPVAEGTVYNIDQETLRLQDELPVGPVGSDKPTLARPNILMFGDWNWLSHNTEKQEKNFTEFKRMLLRSPSPFVIIELGAGIAVPTVRLAGEDLLGGRHTGTLVRINAYEQTVPQGNISLPMDCLEALNSIQDVLNGKSFT